MKNTRRLLALLLVLTLIFSLFSVAHGEQKKPLVFMHMFMQEPIQALFAENEKTFEEMFPEYDLEVRYVPFDEINKQLSIGAASGDVPDITFLNNPDFAAYVEMGCFIDITDMVNAWDEFPQFYPSPLEAGTIDGKVYGLPFDTNCTALFYNKDMLEAKGVAVPTTMDELKDAAAKLTDPAAGAYGLILCGMNGEETTFQFMNFLTAYGGKFDDMSSDAAKEAAQLYVDLVQAGSMSEEIVNMGQNDIFDRFAAKQAAMCVNGTWQVNLLRNGTSYPDLDFNWDVALMPAGSQGSYSCMGGKIIGIGDTGDADRQNMAWEFIKIVCAKDNMMKFVTNVGAVPNRTDIAADPYWETDPQMKVFVDQMETAVPRGPHPRWPEISLAIYTAMGEAITGAKTVDQAFNDAQVAIDAVK